MGAGWTPCGFVFCGGLKKQFTYEGQPGYNGDSF